MFNEMIEKGLKLNTQNIRWCYEWPKNARVERISFKLESKCL